MVLGNSAVAFTDPLSQYGANNSHVAEHEQLKAYSTDGYTTVLAAMLNEHHPEALLMAASALGRGLAPRLASRLKTS